MTTQSDTQKELKKILYQHFFWLSPDINYTEVTQQILDLFRKRLIAEFKAAEQKWQKENNTVLPLSLFRHGIEQIIQEVFQ